MNVKIKEILTKVSGLITKKVAIIAIGGVVTVTGATVIGLNLLSKKTVDKPVNIGAVAKSESEYKAQQKALKELEEKKTADNSAKEETKKEDPKKEDTSSTVEDKKDTSATNNNVEVNKPSDNTNKNNSTTSSDKKENKPSTNTLNSNTAKPNTSNSNTNTAKPNINASNSTNNNTSKPSSSNTQAQTKPSRPSGYDASVTHRINDEEMGGMGYYDRFSSSDLNKLINAAISIANGNGMPDSAKNFHINNMDKDVSYTAHTLNTVFMGNEPARYYTQFKDVARHYGAFQYCVAYWNSSKNGYDVKYVSIGY